MKINIHKLSEQHQDEYSSYYYKNVKITIGQYWLDTRFKVVIRIVDITHEGVKWQAHKDGIIPYTPYTEFLTDFDTFIESCIYLRSSFCSIYEARRKYPEYFTDD